MGGTVQFNTMLVHRRYLDVCAVDGNWGSWTSWSDCSVTCEAIGTQTRTRTCDNPAPANNGLDCDGNDMETNNCDMAAVGCPG